MHKGNSFIHFFAGAMAICLVSSLLAAPAEPKEKDFTPEFVAKCKAKAEAGDAVSQTLYGRALANGWVVKTDHVAAVKWLSKAANAGNAIGQCTLGVCYAKGTGVEKDATMAVEWFRWC